MKFQNLSGLLLFVSAALARSSQCESELKKYDSCLKAFPAALITSEHYYEVLYGCELINSDSCKDFKTDIQTTTSNCDVKNNEEGTDAQTILGMRAFYLMNCATDSKGTSCPLTTHLVSEFEKGGHISYFPDSEVKERELTDWNGTFNSAYRFLKNGDLDEAFAAKDKAKNKSTGYYKDYYTKGYLSDIDKITIDGAAKKVTFTYEDGKTASGIYENQGRLIHNWTTGTKAGMYRYKKTTSEKDGAPIYIMFNDHFIVPTSSEHFHIRYGDEGYEQIPDWENHFPTYYRDDLTAADISAEINGTHNHCHDHDHEHDHEHEEEGDHEAQFNKDIASDCENADCNTRYKNLVAIAKQVTSLSETAGALEDYLKYYNDKTCSNIAAASGASTMKITTSLLAIIIFTIVLLI